MKRATLVKFFAVIVGGILVLYIGLCIAARTGLLPWALHKALAPNSVVYSFSSYEDGRFYNVRRGITADGNVYDGDMGSVMKFCPQRSDWICLDGPTFKFAVPRRDLKVGDHWKFSGVEYTLLPSYIEEIPGGPVPGTEDPLWRYRILGRQYDFYAIKVGAGDGGDIYLFSPQNGLVGFMNFAGASSKDDVRNATFWLEGENGLGSAEFDSSVSTKALLSADEVSALAH